jgi:hypothetical protein
VRPLDIHDAPDDRPKLHECDACAPGCVEQEEAEFIKCDSCDERVCAKHAGENNLCIRCEADLRVCENCHAFNVDTRMVEVERYPSITERRCQRCNPKAWETQEAWEGRYEAV